MAEKETYTMEYRCRRCGTKHFAEVPKGADPEGGYDECPYCGNNSRLDFTYKKPSRLNKGIE